VKINVLYSLFERRWRGQIFSFVRTRLFGFSGNTGFFSPPFPQDVQFKLGKKEICKARLSEEGKPRVLCYGRLCPQCNRVEYKLTEMFSSPLRSN